jgi:putative membrane protein
LLIFSVLPIVVLYLVIKWAVSSALRSISSSFREAFTASRTAREILDERYARGEIGREEYGRMRRDIQAE